MSEEQKMKQFLRVSASNTVRTSVLNENVGYILALGLPQAGCPPSLGTPNNAPSSASIPYYIIMHDL
jgi:hypothetical protein